MIQSRVTALIYISKSGMTHHPRKVWYLQGPSPRMPPKEAQPLIRTRDNADKVKVSRP